MPIYKLGAAMGWLTLLLFAGTIANYVIKAINSKWGKRISSFPAGKRMVAILMKVFVKNHKYFGFGAFIALSLHFTILFLKFGFSVSGIVAAAFLILQVILGIYATVKKKPRRGIWFVAHRSIAFLLVLGIAFHLLIPAIVHTA